MSDWYETIKDYYDDKLWSARLACIRHAASVRPEPGSNSPINGSQVKFTASRGDTCVTCVVQALV
ncbi:hypothetical protein BSG8_42780 [Bacillus subtilis subsp. natto]|nr:hypothetical protein BSG8_42780 [Bacillus subtilis subsp. natto]